MKTTGNALLAEALRRQGIDKVFFIMGGPINDALNACAAGGIKLIDVRHEQAAAMMAHAHSRILAGPSVCMGASGPGTINLTTGLANALVDCAPVVAFGGSAPLSQRGTGAFQDIDQVAIMRPVTKWAERVYETRRIPEMVDLAFRRAMAGKPGPVFLDLPGDVLYAEVDASSVVWPGVSKPDPHPPSGASVEAVETLVRMFNDARRPIILSGSGVLWSGAASHLRRLVEELGVPLYTTPQGRGVIPEDHEIHFGHARSAAFREADLVLVVGTRLNYVFSYGKPPRFSETAKFVRIDIDPDEIASCTRSELGIVGDAAAVLGQLCEKLPDRVGKDAFRPWRERLAEIDRTRADRQREMLDTDQLPIHPLRLCKEIRDFIGRETIMVVDGQEILNFGRQVIPSFMPGHRLNSGPFGTMGVGLPFALGAKAAKPDHEVVVLHGDGSFGLNAMELDTAVRHNLPVLIVVSLNGGWTADPDRTKPGRDLGYTRFDKFAEIFGCHAEFVEKPEDIAPALARARQSVTAGRCALVNVVTDWRARAGTTAFTTYST